jgi:hypothetical protein
MFYNIVTWMTKFVASMIATVQNLLALVLTTKSAGSHFLFRK